MFEDDDGLSDELKAFMKNEGQGTSPEDIFKVVTVMPERKLKITCYLVDKDGDRVEIADIADDLVKYIHEKMSVQENNDVNTQVFPLIGQLMASYTPRAVGMKPAAFLLAAPSIRNALIDLGMASFLMLQYIKQMGLKIVTNEEEISDQEMALYFKNGEKAEDFLKKSFDGFLKDDKDDN